MLAPVPIDILALMTGTELLGGAIGVTMLAVGAVSVLASTLQRRAGDRTLALFGVWCGLYGARLASDQAVIAQTLGVPAVAAQYFHAFVTYVINAPIGLFVESVIGQGWKKSIRRVWQFQAVCAVVAIAGDIIQREPRAMMFLNSPIVFVGIVVALANLLFYRDRVSPMFRSRVMALGAAVLLVFVANENLRRPVFPSVNIEPIGVLVFVLTLGYAVVRRAFEQEAELTAVQRELDTARRIQASLLPRTLPQAGGVELAAQYLPMNAVAGDLYDVVQLGPSRIGVLVADVSGHGVPAALVASMVKLAFTMQREHACDPARVLMAMNQALCRSIEGTFVTAVYGVLDGERRSLKVANAGHPSLLVGRTDGSVTECAERGVMLGLMPDASYSSEELILHPGDRVLLYTDGMPEAQDPRGEFLDGERLAAWLASADGLHADAIAQSLLRNLTGWRGVSGFDDDVTFVVARVPDHAGTRPTPIDQAARRSM